jgi:hypothetical protein
MTEMALDRALDPWKKRHYIRLRQITPPQGIVQHPARPLQQTAESRLKPIEQTSGHVAIPLPASGHTPAREGQP